MTAEVVDRLAVILDGGNIILTPSACALLARCLDRLESHERRTVGARLGRTTSLLRTTLRDAGRAAMSDPGPADVRDRQDAPWSKPHDHAGTDEVLVNTKTAAERLGVSERHVRRLIADDQLGRPLRAGTVLFVTASAVDDLRITRQLRK